MREGRWPGTWRVICDVCGFEFPSDQVKLRWDNLIVCPKDWETKHEQLFIRVREESIGVPFARPEGEDVFIVTCDVISSQARADWGTADCATVDYPNLFNGLSCLLEGIAIANMNVADCMIAETT